MARYIVFGGTYDTIRAFTDAPPRLITDVNSESSAAYIECLEYSFLITKTTSHWMGGVCCKFVNIVYILCTKMAESAFIATGSSSSSVSYIGGLKFLMWVESN